MSMVDLRINVHDDHKKSSDKYHRRCNSLTFPPLFDSLSRTKSLGYNKLHDVPLRLSILKLDGSFFDVQVSSRATVAELKKAVEDVFDFAPLKGFSISWPHVWGNFCLCYRGRKLVETDYIWRYGIQDGDQLQFIHHHSYNCAQSRRQSMKLFTSFYQHNFSEMVWASIDNILHSLFTHLTCLLLLSNKYDYIEKNEENDCYDDMENGKFKHNKKKDNYTVERDEAKWDCVLRRWFLYSGFSKTSAAKSYFGIFGSLGGSCLDTGNPYSFGRRHRESFD